MAEGRKNSIGVMVSLGSASSDVRFGSEADIRERLLAATSGHWKCG